MLPLEPPGSVNMLNISAVPSSWSFSSNNNATSDIPTQLANQVPEITSPLKIYDHPDVYEAISTPLCPTFLLSCETVTV